MRENLFLLIFIVLVFVLFDFLDNNSNRKNKSKDFFFWVISDDKDLDKNDKKEIYKDYLNYLF